MSAPSIIIQPQTPFDEYCTAIFGEEFARLDALYADPNTVPDESARHQIFLTASEILNRCPNPNGAPHQVTGLALGKVQSGKTLSYIALSGLAIDSGYRVIIVLAGRTKALAEQNIARFQQYLVGNRVGLAIARFHNPTRHDQNEIQTILQNGRVIFITLLKHQDRIEQVRQIFSSGELNRYPVLIIDDEGDQASHNTRRYQDEESAIYAQIRQLKDTFPLHGFVSYTATPQANLLASAIDSLAPEFCVLVEPGPNYTGGTVFFGDESAKYVRIIPVDEAERESHEGVPAHMRLALATFLVAGAILHRRSPSAQHSMLIHSSNRKADHEHLYQSVTTCIDGWKSVLALPSKDPATVELASLLRDAHWDLSTTVENCPSLDELLPQIRQEIGDLKVWLVNSLPQGSNPSSTPFNLRNNIMIGGNMLDRGVTIPGLAVTYITRYARNSQADTIEQRARWFGYKWKYLDLCRIYTSSEIAEVFKELLTHEDDFWESLSRYSAQGLPVTKWPRLFRLGLGIRPTRSSVARTRAFRAGDWTIETHPNQDAGAAQRNLSRITGLFSHSGASQAEAVGSSKHLVYKDYEPESLLEWLKDYETADEQEWDTSYVIEFLERLVLGKGLNGIDLVLMDEGRLRERTLMGGVAINPMQGKSANYPGDRYIFPGRAQMQFHNIGLRRTEQAQPFISTTSLALYLPNEERFDLGSFRVPTD